MRYNSGRKEHDIIIRTTPKSAQNEKMDLNPLKCFNSNINIDFSRLWVISVTMRCNFN